MKTKSPGERLHSFWLYSMHCPYQISGSNSKFWLENRPLKIGVGVNSEQYFGGRSRAHVWYLENDILLGTSQRHRWNWGILRTLVWRHLRTSLYLLDMILHQREAFGRAFKRMDICPLMRLQQDMRIMAQFVCVNGLGPNRNPHPDIYGCQSFSPLSDWSSSQTWTHKCRDETKPWIRYL